MRVQSRKTLAVALAVLLAFACLVPYFACAAHRSHGCPGNEFCQVCRAIEESMLHLRLLVLALAMLCALLAHRVRGSLYACADLPKLFVRTPVACKVRLND